MPNPLTDAQVNLAGNALFNYFNQNTSVGSNLFPNGITRADSARITENFRGRVLTRNHSSEYND